MSRDEIAEPDAAGLGAAPAVPPQRLRLRAAIRAAVAQAEPLPVAERTLQLLTEAAAEPIDADPYYRVIDRAGAPRLREGTPMSLDDLVAELRGRHPGLFVPRAEPEPEPEPAPAPKPAAEPLINTAEIQAATARFVNDQAGRARGLTERARERAQSLSRTAGATLAGWRARAATHPAAAAPGTASPSEIPPAGKPPEPPRAAIRAEMAARTRAASFAGIVGRTARNLRSSAGTRAAALRTRIEQDTGEAPHRRPALWAVGGVALLAVAVLLAIVGGDDASQRETASSPQVERQPPASEANASAAKPPPFPADALASGEAAPAEKSSGNSANSPGRDPAKDLAKDPEAGAEGKAPPAPSSQAAAQEGPPPDGPDPGETPPAPSGFNEIRGVPEVVDTATLRVGGKLVRLFGVEWVRGAQAQDLVRYLSGRSVACQPVAGSQNMSCQVGGRDLSEVVLFNGGGRASSEASPDLVEAEDHARAERLGVWKR